MQNFQITKRWMRYFVAAIVSLLLPMTSFSSCKTDKDCKSISYVCEKTRGTCGVGGTKTQWMQGRGTCDQDEHDCRLIETECACTSPLNQPESAESPLKKKQLRKNLPLNPRVTR